jgi:hypothetical protein
MSGMAKSIQATQKPKTGKCGSAFPKNLTEFVEI